RGPECAGESNRYQLAPHLCCCRVRAGAFFAGLTKVWVTDSEDFQELQRRVDRDGRYLEELRGKAVPPHKERQKEKDVAAFERGLATDRSRLAGLQMRGGA